MKVKDDVEDKREPERERDRDRDSDRDRERDRDRDREKRDRDRDRDRDRERRDSGSYLHRGAAFWFQIQTPTHIASSLALGFYFLLHPKVAVDAMVTIGNRMTGAMET